MPPKENQIDKYMKTLRTLILTITLLFISVNAGSFSTGIGIGMTYALLSPKVGYEFDNGLGIDFALSYFKPEIDYNLGLNYNFKLLLDEIYIGPRITLGHREYEYSRGGGFEATFFGLSGNFRTYFLIKNYIDLQFGLELFTSKYYSNREMIGIEPTIGMSYGFDFNKIVIGDKIKANRSSFSKGAITTGQIFGGLLICFGGVITGIVIPDLSQPDEYGFTQGILAIGLTSICIGSFDIILLNKLRFQYKSADE